MVHLLGRNTRFLLHYSVSTVMPFHQSFDPKLWTCLLIFAGICCMVLVAAVCYASHALHGNAKINRRIKVYSILSLTCFLVAQIFSALYIYFVKLPGHKMSRGYLWCLYSAFWSFGYLFTYLYVSVLHRDTLTRTLPVDSCTSV